MDLPAQDMEVIGRAGHAYHLDITILILPLQLLRGGE